MANTNKSKSKKAVVAKGASKKVAGKASKKSLAKGVTKGDKKFTPTTLMWQLLMAKLNPEIKPTITAECEAAGVSRKTYYEWFKNEDFVTWFQDEFRKGMRERGPYLDKVGLIMATKDYRYWAAMQEKTQGFTTTDVREYRGLQGILDEIEDDEKGLVSSPKTEPIAGKSKKVVIKLPKAKVSPHPQDG